MSSEPGAVSPPKVKIGSSNVIVVEFTVVVVPLTIKLPATVTSPPLFILILSTELDVPV